MSRRIYCALFIFLAIATHSGSAAENQMTNDPALLGQYYRMICNHGAKTGKSMEYWMADYPAIHEAGCDGIYAYYNLLAEGEEPPPSRYMSRSVKSIAQRLGISPQEYVERSIRMAQTNNLDVWMCYWWPKIKPIDPNNRALVLEDIRRYTRQLSNYPHFRGFAYDEPAAGRSYSASTMSAFKVWLLRKYNPAQLRELGLGVLTNAATTIVGPAEEITVAEHPVLLEHYQRYLKQWLDRETVANGETGKHKEQPISSESFREWLMEEFSSEELLGMKLEAVLREDTKFILPKRGESAPTPEPKPGQGLDTILDELAQPEAPRKKVEPPKRQVLVIPANYEKNPVLYMEYEEFCWFQFNSLLAGMEAATREIRPDAITFPVFSFMSLMHMPLRSSLAHAGRTCGAISCDPYWDGAQETGFWAKIMRAQARGPSFLTIASGKYSRGPNRFARDLATGLVHSPAINIWAWDYARKFPAEYTKDMGKARPVPGNYEVMVKIFERIEKIRPYLVPSSSTARIALVYSERESMWDQGGLVAWPRQHGFVANCYGLHCAFAQMGLQYEPIFEELLDRAELDRYEVVILPCISYLRPESQAAIEGWVKAGGTLIAMGAIGIKDAWGRPTGKPSSIANLTGANCTPIKEMDSLALKDNSSSAVSARYNRMLTEFKLEPSTAQPAGFWNDGSVAITRNPVGRGTVVALGADKFGCCYLGWGGGRRFPIHKDFFPGVLDLLKQVILSGSEERQAAWPLQAVNVPPDVEVTVRSQPGRYVVHLLNYAAEPECVTNARVELRLPPDAGPSPAVFYPADLSRAEHAVTGSLVRVSVRDFDVHEAFVLQYDGRTPKTKPAKAGAMILPVLPPAKDRTIAYFGEYPGASVARELDIRVREYPVTFLDRPIDFDSFSRRHFMIACNLMSLSRTQLEHLTKYVQAGGILQLFEISGFSEDINGNYGRDRMTEGKFFKELTGGAEQSQKNVRRRCYYTNRVRLIGRHPILKSLSVNQWFDFSPGGDSPSARGQFNSSFFDPVPSEDVFIEADLYKYGEGNEYELPGKPYEIKPVVLLHAFGKGWVLWDTTYASVTASGAHHPEMKKLAVNFLLWARDFSPR
ncbi:MAG: beta-galactosidase trimerization domain-containing protein [Kiritimatiellae bacterium]|nr:beta-galactosidase trimerization domain-containing protein [Kiritimatiellia bacterium]